MAKINYKKLTNDIIEEVGAGVQEGTPEFASAMKYVEAHWSGQMTDKASAKSLGLTPKEYAMNSIGNGILDGMHLDDFPIEEADAPKGQEIVEVDQNEVKKALHALLTRENDVLGWLYDKWNEYNDLYFYGQLSFPLITIEKLSNKTLGNYTHGADAMGITNHIRMNRNFIALNSEERILETLRHEMIHQWQDEVLYMAEGIARKDITLPVGFGHYLDKEPTVVKRSKDNAPIGEKGEQKKRPKEWHNRDFKEYAVVVGIPAKGDKCYGNPADMPKGQSYNRKYQCKCIASNNSRVTIWSTREIDARCNVCGKPYVEQVKEGELVPVTMSHIEMPGEDLVAITQKGKGFEHFQNFGSKKEADAFVDALYAGSDDALEMERGVYQKGHNAYKEGRTHWVSFNGKAELPKEEKKKPAPKKAPTKKAPVKTKKEEPKPEPEVEQPAPDVIVEPEPQPEPKPKKPRTKKAPKKEEPKPEPKKEEELPKVETPTEGYKDGATLLALYAELGSIKAVAEHFGLTPPNIIYWAKKLGVDFKKGVMLDGKANV